MKLNNRGWGLSTFIGFVVLFFIFLIVAGISAYKAGMAKKPGIEIIPGNSTSVTNYSDLELKVANAARMYRNDKYSDTSGEIIISVSTLLENNYLNDVGNCNGYAIVTANSQKAYISCGGYITSGYDYNVE